MNKEKKIRRVKNKRTPSTTPGAIANRERLLKVQAEARRIRSINSDMKQAEAVKAAWVSWRAGLI